MPAQKLKSQTKWTPYSRYPPVAHSSSPLSLANHPPVTCWVAVAVCDIWLNNFRLQNVSESQGKVDFPTHVCVCVCCVDLTL